MGRICSGGGCSGGGYSGAGGICSGGICSGGGCSCGSIVADDEFQDAAPRCMAHKTVACGAGPVITAKGRGRRLPAWKTRPPGPESPTRISQSRSLLRVRVEVSKLGNWPTTSAVACVVISGSIRWVGVRILPMEPLSVAYQTTSNMPNPKTSPFAHSFNLLHPS
jgi:hypothetical protein